MRLSILPECPAGQTDTWLPWRGRERADSRAIPGEWNPRAACRGGVVEAALSYHPVPFQSREQNSTWDRGK
eukprot:1816898-Rhodomonas_salina.1